MTRKCHVRFGGGPSEKCLYGGNSPAAYPTLPDKSYGRRACTRSR
jgi:hypothetical protein